MKTIVTFKKAHFHWSLALLCHPHHWFFFRLIEFLFIYLCIYVFIYLCLFCKRIKCCTTIRQHTHTKIKVSLRQYTHHVRGCAHSSVHGTSNSKLTDRYFFYYAVITHENRTTVFKVHMQTKYRCVDFNSQFKRSAFVF